MPVVSVSNTARRTSIFRVSVFLLLIVLALLKIAITAWQDGSILDSDKVAQLLLVKDIFSAKIFFPTDSFFLKMPLYWLSSFLWGENQWTMVSLTFLHIAVCLSGFFALLYVLFRKKIPWWSFALVSIWIMSQSHMFFYYLGYPTSRGFEMGLYFLFLALFFEISVERQRFLRPIWLWGICIVLAFIFFGDPYWEFALGIPFLLTYLYTSIRNKTFKPVSAPLVIGIAWGMALFLRFFTVSVGWFSFSPTEPVLVGGYEQLIRNLQIFGEGFLQLHNAFFFQENLISGSGLMKVGNVFLLVFGIYGLAYLFQANRKKKPWYLLFVLTVLIITGLYIFSNKVIDIASTRYLVPVPFLVSIGLAACLSYKNTITRYGLGIIVGIISAANLINFAVGVKLLPYNDVNSQSAVLVDFLKSRGLEYGYSGYWLANSTTYFSEESVRIRAVICDKQGRLKPYQWLSAESWYRPSGYLGKTFVIGDRYGNVWGCPASYIIAQMGYPTTIEQLQVADQILSVYIFPYNIAERFTENTNYRFGQSIQAQDQGYFISGWSPLEEDHRWSAESIVKIGFRLADAGSLDRLFTFVLKPRAVQRQQEVSLRVNGVPIPGVMKFANGDTLLQSLTFHGSLLKPEGYNILTLEIPNAQPESENGPRLLGIDMGNMAILRQP